VIQSEISAIRRVGGQVHTIDEPSDGNCEEFDPTTQSVSTAIWSNEIVHYRLRTSQYLIVSLVSQQINLTYGIEVCFIEFSAYASGYSLALY